MSFKLCANYHLFWYHDAVELIDTIFVFTHKYEAGPSYEDKNCFDYWR